MTATRLDLDGVALWTGDARTILAAMPPASVGCVVTSPPYWRQRDYGVPGQLGLEDSLEAYVASLAAVFDQLARVLTPTGTGWLNLGDSYSSGPSLPCRNQERLRSATARHACGAKRGLPTKNLAGVPWRVALELQNRGWILRSEIIWHKPNAIPESVADRPARRHEHLFLLTRSPRYYFNLDAIRQPYSGDRPLSRRARRTGHKPNTIARPWPAPGRYDDVSAFPRPHEKNLRDGHPHTTTNLAGRNPGTVWSLSTRPSRHHHYSAFPIDIPHRRIAAGCPPDKPVLDPFSGSGTTLLAARALGHPAIGIDLNPAFHLIAKERLAEQAPSQSRHTEPTP